MSTAIATAEPFRSPDLYERVSEMVCCILDCGLSGRELDEYVREWMADGHDGQPEDVTTIVGELQRQLDAMDPMSRAYFAYDYARIEASIRKVSR